MLRALFDYFNSILVNRLVGGTPLYTWLNSVTFNIGGQDISLLNYLSFIFALISFVIIVVLCCLFIYRLIRVVSRLFMGA